MTNLTLSEWLNERLANSVRLADTKTGAERQGWLDDAAYLRAAGMVVRQLAEASAGDHPNHGLRVYIALKILRAWNNGTTGYSTYVVATVNDWIDGGMRGPVPWPSGPFFAEWAAKNGLSRVGDYVGFKLEVELAGIP